MKSAYMMSSSEFLKLFAVVKLGVYMGIIKTVNNKTLTELLIGAMPATLMLENGKDTSSDTERDKLRAEYVKKTV